MHNSLWLIFILLIGFNSYGQSVPIDNGVEGQPDVSCQQDSAKMIIKTRKPFYGHIYVKGQYRLPDCHSDLTDGQGQIPQGQAPYSVPKRVQSYPGASANDGATVEFSVSYRSCYVKRERIINPPGLSYTATVVVQFHHLFSTKVDKAYSVTCFYMEAQKSVTFNFDVSMLSSVELFQTRPMPICTYEVRRSGVTGPPVKFAQVGEEVFHRWTCTGGDDVYGMLVHSCVASDGSGTEYRLVDQLGCSIDPIAVGDLTYSQDLLTAYVEVHVFKFADRMQVSFQCQVSLCLKLENGCKGITPPLCTQAFPKPTMFGHGFPPSPTPPEFLMRTMPNALYLTTTFMTSAPSTSYPSRTTTTIGVMPPYRLNNVRNHRSVNSQPPDLNTQGTMDLTTDDIFIFNLDDKLPAELISSRNGSRLSGWSPTIELTTDRVCMSSFGLTQIIFAMILTFCILSAAMVYCQRRYYTRLIRRNPQNVSSNSIFN